MWLTDSKGRRVGVPPTRSRTSKSPATPRSQGRLRQPVARLVSGPAARLLDRRCLFFTGKGGVGKSTMAAATAVLARDTASGCSLVEVDAKGDVPAQFEHSPVGFTPKEIHPGVLAMAMDTEASLQEYLRLNLRVPVIGRMGPLASVLDFVATRRPA